MNNPPSPDPFDNSGFLANYYRLVNSFPHIRELAALENLTVEWENYRLTFFDATSGAPLGDVCIFEVIHAIAIRREQELLASASSPSAASSTPETPTNSTPSQSTPSSSQDHHGGRSHPEAS